MSRYIEAEKIIETISIRLDMQDLYLPVHFLDLIDDIPTADVADVVRCKDCKCYELMKSNNKHFCNEFGGYITESDFCSRGERRKRG